VNKRYFLDPFGCAKNQVDAELMMAHLNAAGWTACAGADDADLVIVHSCGFIEDAKRESINAVLAWRKRYPGKKIFLSGCLAKRYGAELADSLPEADIISGESPSCAAALAATAAGAASAGPRTAPRSTVPEYAGPECDPGLRPLLGFPGQAYVKISEGCNNHCSFCAIPLIRGGLRCRTVPDIVKECEALVARGVKELCLVGQDLASYEVPDGEKSGVCGASGLSRLLAAIARLSGRFWVRLLYLHPDHVPLDILEIMKSDRRFLPYFDIPFQHASAPVLTAMNRRGDGASYLRLLDKVRSVLPGAVIRSTFLTGFPGETEEDFRALLAFQNEARFDWLGVFTFSREEGTAAYSMKGRVAKKCAAERKAIIEENQIPITEELMNRFTGLTLEALVEESLETERNGGETDSEVLWIGRVFCQAPDVDGATVLRRGASSGAVRPGDLVPCRILRRAGFDLEAELETGF
jgi:ribosomal protein S12 methylthiotransferase